MSCWQASFSIFNIFFFFFFIEQSCFQCEQKSDRNKYYTEKKWVGTKLTTSVQQLVQPRSPFQPASCDSRICWDEDETPRGPLQLAFLTIMS